jgi:nucleotide-binding universal stress UspA family protein
VARVAEMTIVVGYDGSETSKSALEYAVRRLAEGGQLFIVHAYELPPDFLGHPHLESWVRDRKALGRAVLDGLQLGGRDDLAKIKYEAELIGGPAAPAIADVARVRNADEIVVGSRGHGRVRVLIGSVSHELLHIADRPVVVIPHVAGNE